MAGFSGINDDPIKPKSSPSTRAALAAAPVLEKNGNLIVILLREVLFYVQNSCILQTSKPEHLGLLVFHFVQL